MIRKSRENTQKQHSRNLRYRVGGIVCLFVANLCWADSERCRVSEIYAECQQNLPEIAQPDTSYDPFNLTWLETTAWSTHGPRKTDKPTSDGVKAVIIRSTQPFDGEIYVGAKLPF